MGTETVILAQNGDQHAFKSLVLEHTPALLPFAASRLPTAEEVDDVLQETWLLVWQNLSTCREPERFPGWVFQICRSVIRTHYEAKRKTVGVSGFDEAFLDWLAGHTEEDEDARGEAERRLACLKEALDGLPETDQQLIDWRYRDRLPLKSISEMTGRPLKSVSNSIRRILDSLHKSIQTRMQKPGSDQTREQTDA